MGTLVQVIQLTGCIPPCSIRTYDFALEGMYRYPKWMVPFANYTDMVLSVYSPKSIMVRI